MPLTLRLDPPLPDDALVLRGGMMLARDLRVAAERCEAALGFPGISVFAAAGASFRELLLAAPALRTYRVVRRTTAGAVRRVGCELVATGASPHFTLRLPAVDFPTLARLRDVFGPPIPTRSLGSLQRRRTPMADDMDVWVDYHDIDDEGHVLTLRKFFVSLELAAVGRRVVTGDYEGNRCEGTVVEIDANDIVAIELDEATLVRSRRPTPAGRE